MLILCINLTRWEINQILSNRHPFLNARKRVVVGKGIVFLEHVEDLI